MASTSKYEDYDFDKDEITPEIVKQQMLAHDKRMRDGRSQWSLSKACYTTNYWKHVRGHHHSSKRDHSRGSDIDIEVNRLWGVITSYLSALYPRANRAVVGPDSTGIGDATKAELVINRWLSSNRVHTRVMTGLRQALLYPGCGAKVGYYPGRGNPLDRVWMRIIPWWEMVLDSDVGDAEDERFRGHLYYRLKSEVQEEYGIQDLGGTSRDDFLHGQSKETNEKGKKYGKNKQAESDDSAFVRVLELCNLKDTWVDPENPDIVYEGRLEIYVLGQGKLSNKPIWIGPLPFAEVDGQPMPHVVPLIFNYEPEFPLRGLAHAARILPQIQELNAYRSFMAMATRKDTRQFITRKGTFGSDELTDLTEGHDGLILQLDQDYDRPLSDAIVGLPNAPISSNVDQYMSIVQDDLERNIGMSPSARGIVTKATAFEVQAVQQYTESDFGMHASIKDDWLSNLCSVVLRALIASMQDLGDSAGAFEGQDVALGEVGAVSIEEEGLGNEPEESPFGETEDTQVEVAEEQQEDAEQEPFINEDSLEGFTEDAQEPDKIEPEVLRLRDRREFLDIGVEDLDARFEITFIEGGGAPMDEASKQQNLLGLLEPYSALWAAVQEGGPQAAMARAYMKAIAEKFHLPKDLHPDEIEARMAEEAEEAGIEGQDQEAMAAATGDPEGQMPMAPGEAPMEPPAMEPPPPPDPNQIPQQLQGLLDLPPDQAILALRDMFGDDPEMQKVLSEMEQLPPEQQSEMIAALLQSPGEPVAAV